MDTLKTYSQIGIADSHPLELFFKVGGEIRSFDISELRIYGDSTEQMLVAKQQEEQHDPSFLKRSVLAPVRENDVTLRVILWKNNGCDVAKVVEVDFPHDIYEHSDICSDPLIHDKMLSSSEALVLF